jgi:hypothetical protein
MNRNDYIKICNQLTFLEKQMFTMRQKYHNDNSEYEKILREYLRLSNEIIRGKEEEDGGDKFLFEEDETL